MVQDKYCLEKDSPMRKFFLVITAVVSILSFFAGRYSNQLNDDLFYPLPTSTQPQLEEKRLNIPSTVAELSFQVENEEQSVTPRQSVTTIDLTGEVANDDSFDQPQEVTKDNDSSPTKRSKDELLQKIASISKELTEAKILLQENGLSLSSITQEQLEEILPPFFAQQLASSPGIGSKALEFSKEEQDYGWAFLKQQQIKDFFIMHPVGHTINLVSVKCKTQSCEIMGFSSQDDSFTVVVDDMQKEPWWDLRSSTSTSGQPSDQGKMFYLLASTSFM